MRTKKHENLTQANISKVIEYLNPKDGSKPITKKEACSILNIAYNTTRLGNIIAEFEEMQDGDVKDTLADNSKIINWIGNIKETSLTTGVKKFVNWYKSFYKND